jgi:hypothetical protein
MSWMIRSVVVSRLLQIHSKSVLLQTEDPLDWPSQSRRTDFPSLRIEEACVTAFREPCAFGNLSIEVIPQGFGHREVQVAAVHFQLWDLSACEGLQAGHLNGRAVEERPGRGNQRDPSLCPVPDVGRSFRFA